MAQGEVRIIAGQWRGRKLKVPNVANLRPTPNRVRETLFNWLMPTIMGSYCLDPFAGSGALGFEALSRGAAHVTMIDQSLEVVKVLKEEAQRLKTADAEIYCAKVPSQLRQPKKPFDIIFLDPPFHENLLLPTCFYLEENDFLAENALIYLESKEVILEDDLPSCWHIIKSKVAGGVVYQLVKRTL